MAKSSECCMIVSAAKFSDFLGPNFSDPKNNYVHTCQFTKTESYPFILSCC